MNALTDYDPSSLINILSKGFISEVLWIDITTIIILIVCFLGSFFFSMAETSLSSANPIRLRKFAEDKKRGARKAELLLENYDRTITTILIGNNLANIGASTTSVFIFTKLIHQNLSLANIVSTVVMTLLIITFGEIIPKTYAKANATNVAIKISGLLWIFYKLFYPLAIFFMKLSSAITKGREKEDPTVTNEELETIIDNMEFQGIIDEDHAELLQGALTIGDKKVSDIMTHRVDLIAVEINMPIKEILDVFLETKYTRLPVFKKSKDNIVGILNDKDLLSAYIKAKNKNNIKIEEIITDVMYISKSTRVDDLIKKMQNEKKHFAIVSDEFGGTSGIVTMEDALEELVGEIYDEYDYDEMESYLTKLDNNKYILSADYELKKLYDNLDVGLIPTNEFHSVGSYLYSLSEDVLVKGKKIKVISNKTIFDEEKSIDLTYELTFTITKVQNRRIKELELIVTDITNIEN